MPKPVIYVPGYPGSHIHDENSGKRLFVNIGKAFKKKELIRRLQAPDEIVEKDGVEMVKLDDAVAGEPIGAAVPLGAFDIDKQAKTLYRLLAGLDVEPVKFGWDWRRPVWDPPMLNRLKEEIEELDEGVVCVVHSTGGLVLRALLERERENVAFLRRIERIMAFGVPWAGTLKSLIFLAGQKGFALVIAAEQAQQILSHSWAAFDLLPPDPDTTVMEDEDGNPLNLVVDGEEQVNPLAQQDWYPEKLRDAMRLRAETAHRKLGHRSPTIELEHPIPIVNVVGWGWPTAVQARISGNPQTVGKIQEVPDDETLDDGDGTVPRRSAAWLRGAGVTTYHVPVGVVPGATVHPHKALWSNPGGRNLLRHHLRGDALEPFLYGAVDQSDFTSGARVRLRLVALDGGGRPLTDASVRTVDLEGNQQVEAKFDAAFQGRCLITVPRQRIPAEGTQLRRFTVEIRGKGGGGDVVEQVPFFIRR